MAHPLELVRDAARDEWSDPVATARRATEGLISLTRTEWTTDGVRAARMLRGARPDSPLLLAVTEAALTEDGSAAAIRLEGVLERLDDRIWTADLGLAVAHHLSLGITSLAAPVLEVVEAAARLGDSRAELFADRRAVAKGLGYLGLPVEVAPPEEAEVLLLPGVASTSETVWTSRPQVDTALAASVRGRRVVPVVHPVARLSAAGLIAFRPGLDLTEIHLT